MSFEFPKPVPESIDSSPESMDSSPDSVSDENHYDLMSNPEPDYDKFNKFDKLRIHLSLSYFNRLPPIYQRELAEEIRQNVNVEDVEEQSPDEAFRETSFAELFKKLNVSEQRNFQFKVAEKFKREFLLGELMSSFQQLDAEHQQQLIEKIVHVTPETLRNPGETDEELRLRRLTQLSRDYTDRVYKLVVAWKQSNQDEQEETSSNENGSDCFAEFFFGFSIVWFQGQSSSSQDLLIEQLSRGVKSSVVTENCLPHESEEDFKLRRFKGLCKQVVDFGVQEKFLDNAEYELETWQVEDDCWSIVEPQDSDSAAELLSLLTCFRFSLLSPMYQQKKIDEMSNQVDGVEIETSPAAVADEERIRMTRFKELFNQVPGPERKVLFEQFRSIFYQEKCYSQLIRFFSRLGSKDQAELLDKLFNKITKVLAKKKKKKITKVDPWEEWDSAPAQLIMEKFWGESEEEFRLRRFQDMCIKHLRTCKDFFENADEKLVRNGILQLYRTSESDRNYQESSSYAEFLFGASIIWYKARCANYRRNPVQVILFGEVELGDTIEKLAEETEEDFRLRRVTESFKQLEFTSQVRIVDYIQHTLFGDVAYPLSGPQPDLVSSNSSGSHSYSGYDSDEEATHIVYRNGSSNSRSYFHFDELLRKREPDYDELLIRLSHYAFNRLSPTDQREQVEEICRNVDVVEDVQQPPRPEESDEVFRPRTFAELFNKLNFSDQYKLFLSKVIQKFKRERKLGELMSSFQQLDAKHQQQVIEKIVHVTPKSIRNTGETEEELRLRRFTQLSRDYTDHVYKLVVAWKSDDEHEETSDNENGSDWKSCFADFFLGFSIVWFKGQSSSSQDLLIVQLSKVVRGVVIVEQRLQEGETKEDFKLRRFTELCKKMVDLRLQEELLNYAELKLETWGRDRCSRLIHPQEYVGAEKLLSDLSTLGFSLLSAKSQQQLQHKIEERSKLAAGGVTIETTLEDDHFRMTRFTELFNQGTVRTRSDLFGQLREELRKEKQHSEAVCSFGGLGSMAQTKMNKTLSHIFEKLSGESEEDFRLRRFKKMLSEHDHTSGCFWSEADRERVRQGTSEESPYDKFLFDASITWFKAQCGNYRRNPLQVILFGEVEFGDANEKVPEESEEDFRLTRFTESFKGLEFTFQERIVDYIHHTLLYDLGTVPLRGGGRRLPSEGRGEFDPEWIKMKLLDLPDPGAAAAAPPRGVTAATQAGGGTAASQAGGGRGQGTSTSTVL